MRTRLYSAWTEVLAGWSLARQSRPFVLSRLVLFLLLGFSLAVAPALADDKIDFRRDIRPILSDKCFRCHGPDESQRQSGLRLDTRDGALAPADSEAVAIVPGKSDQSELVRRVLHDNAEMRMPPPDEEEGMTAEEIDLLVGWIDQGAEMENHWAFTPARRPAIPSVRHAGHTRSPIDHFILTRVEREGLKPSPEADRRVLARRAALDLTGLPPSAQVVESFLQDRSPDAYERLVDRLLSSPHYGEHMGRYWLDAARYGDTHGLHLDNYREMWPYRDWVIHAFNANLPFDQFVVQQLGGDLLPDATIDQQIASGFNRCHVTTSEGGSIEEECYVRNVVDRIETMGTAFMGLTIGCARCHDHKYDPISQKEFYQFFAFFNNLDGSPLDGNAKNPSPTVTVPTSRQQAGRRELLRQEEALVMKLEGARPKFEAAQRAWEAEWSGNVRARWRSLDTRPFGASGKEGNSASDAYEISAPCEPGRIVAIRLEVLGDESGAAKEKLVASGGFTLSEFEAEFAMAAAPDRTTKIPLRTAYAHPSQMDDAAFPVAQMIDGVVGSDNGWTCAEQGDADVAAVFGLAQPLELTEPAMLTFRLHFASPPAQHLVGRLRVSVATDPTLAPVALGDWSVIGPFLSAGGDEAYYDAYVSEEHVDLDRSYGELQWQQRSDYVDGKVHYFDADRIGAHYLFRTVYAVAPRTLTLSLGSGDALRVWLNGQQVSGRNVVREVGPDQDTVRLELDGGENHLLMKVTNAGGRHGFFFRPIDRGEDEYKDEILAIVDEDSQQRTEIQSEKLHRYYRRNYTEAGRRDADDLCELRKRIELLEQQIALTLVMKERPEPRPAYLLIRGQYDRRGEPVARSTPACLPPMDEQLPRDRLGLARWLTQADHPLTARVAVNRFWQQLFGRGLVVTSEDFGSQGTPPSHEHLLDWLATRFVDDQWDVKRSMRRIVTSATYRQDSRITPALRQADLQNVLLARGPRLRLDGEVLRDQALAVSGLLVREMGGPSVKPPQPSGLWYAVGYTISNTAKFTPDQGRKIYRRSVYTFWKRTSPPPQLSTFDAPSREACVMRRERTNTPLQALLLMNEVQYLDAARQMAISALAQSGMSTRERARWIFEQAAARPPGDADLDTLVNTVNQLRAYFREHGQAAAELARPTNLSTDRPYPAEELATWTVIGNLILNLDEVVTKG